MLRIIPILLLTGGSLLATVELTKTQKPVFLAGSGEIMGGFTLTFDDDDLNFIRDDYPGYLVIRFYKGAVHARSLVHILTQDESVRRKIKIAMYKTEGCYQLAAPEDTVTLVRWVEGEDTIWLRFNLPTAQWLIDENGEPAPPSRKNPVKISLGLNSEETQELFSSIPAEFKNLEGNQRQNSTELTETTLCLDLSRRNGSETDLFYTAFHGHVADLGFGRYEETNVPFDVPFHGDYFWSLGTYARISCSPVKLSPISSTKQPIVKAGQAWNLHTEQLSYGITCRSPNHNPGTQWIFTLPDADNYGFHQDHLPYFEGDYPAQVSLSNPFEADGETLYKLAELIWEGPQADLSDATGQIRLPILTNASEPLTEPPPLEWSLSLATAGWGVLAPEVFQITRWPIHAERLQLTNLADAAVLPHLTAPNSSFETWLQLWNPTSEPLQLEVRGLAADGSLKAQHMLEVLTPNQTRILAIRDLLPEGDYLELRPKGLAEVALVYKSTQAAVPAVTVRADESKGTLWHLSPAASESAWEGIALVNVGEAATPITITLMAADGTVLAEKEQESALAPGAKSLFLLDDLATKATPGSIYILEAPLAEIVVMGLRGDPSTGVFWPNPARKAL